MPSGALLLPMTKVGAGDKERAYIVRQNIVLKTIFAVLAALFLLGTTLCCTIYKVDLQRRTSLKDAREHREEEHNSHMRIMRLGMLLQQRLKDEVHDMKVLTTYRSWLLRSVGDYQGQVLQKLGANCTLADEQLRSLGLQFDQRIDALMKRLWDDLVQEGRAAQTQLHNITTAIMHELRQDASEASDFEALMRANGEDARDDVEGDGDYDEHEEDHDLGVALAEFHERLQRNDSVLALDAPTLERWQQQYDATMRVLSTQEEEADMVRINKNLDALVAASHAPPCAAASTPRRGTRRAALARPIAQPPARPPRPQVQRVDARVGARLLHRPALPRQARAAPRAAAQAARRVARRRGAAPRAAQARRGIDRPERPPARHAAHLGRHRLARRVLLQVRRRA